MSSRRAQKFPNARETSFRMLKLILPDQAGIRAGSDYFNGGLELPFKAD